MWKIDLLYKREERRNRQNKIWAILRYVLAYDNLLTSADFYSFYNNLTEYENAKQKLWESSPDDYSLRTAVRFCRLEYYNGVCDHELTEKDIKAIYNWQSITIDIHDILTKVLISYKEYWDDVLASYKRQSARIKRLRYLVDNLEDVSKSSYIQEYPDIIHGVKELQETYRLQIQ